VRKYADKKVCTKTFISHMDFGGSSSVSVVRDFERNHHQPTPPIVEFGAGISTLYVGALLKKLVGTLIPFDHDADRHRVACGIIQKNGLGDTGEQS
jgi:hypothetical protein